MNTYKIKRLWNNLASVRDYMVDNCVREKQDLLLVMDGVDGELEYMLIPWQELETKKFQISTRKITSKYGAKDYELVDFAWKPNHEQ